MGTSAQRNFQVEVTGSEGNAGIPGLFATKQGGDKTSASNKVWNGGQRSPEILSAPPEISDITVGRPYDKDRDGPLLRRLRDLVGRGEFTVVVTPVDRDGVVDISNQNVYPNALLTSVKEPDYNAAGGDAATFELTFTVPSVT